MTVRATRRTIACGLASVFANSPKSVLVIDIDPQSNAAYALGIDPSTPGTAELLMGEHPIPLIANDYLHDAINRFNPCKGLGSVPIQSRCKNDREFSCFNPCKGLGSVPILTPRLVLHIKVRTISFQSL